MVFEGGDVKICLYFKGFKLSKALTWMRDFGDEEDVGVEGQALKERVNVPGPERSGPAADLVGGILNKKEGVASAKALLEVPVSSEGGDGEVGGQVTGC